MKSQEEAVGPIGPLWEELRTTRFWFLLLLGIIGILVSIVIDLNLYITETSTPLSIDQKVNILNTFWYKNWRTFGFLLRDLGFASLIALFIGVLVERVSRAQQQRAAEQQLGMITRYVLEAAYGINMPAEIAKATMASIFAAPIVRKNAVLDFTLREPAADENIHNAEKYKVLVVTSSYDLENVSGREVDHVVRLYLPLPSDPSLKHASRVMGGSIGDTHLSMSVIKEGDEIIKDTDYERRYHWPTKLNPGEKKRVVINYILLKETSDNEVWTSLVSSTALEVHVNVHCRDIEWNIDSRHSGNLRSLDGSLLGPRGQGSVIFQTLEPLLPYHGVTLWWRPRYIPPSEEQLEPLSPSDEAVADATRESLRSTGQSDGNG